MTETVWVTIITGAVTVATVYLQTRKQTQRLSGEVAEVHQIVNSQRTAMEASIEALKVEIARLNAGGAPTPDGVPPVTTSEGRAVVTPTGGEG